jgi:hypothetical protein
MSFIRRARVRAVGEENKNSEQSVDSSAPQSSSRPTRTYLFYLVLLVVATVATYYPARNHPFLHFDDSKYVTANPQVQGGLSWSTVEWAFTTYYASNWHPLTWLSHALDCQMFGPGSGGAARGQSSASRGQRAVAVLGAGAATGMAGRSAMVAGLFALHPMNVETVAWVAERKNLLSMLFLLLALAAYRWYAKQPGAGRYVLVAFLFVLGLMAKPQVITLPFLLLLWDYWPLQRMTLRTRAEGKQAAAALPGAKLLQLVVEKLPLLAISAISAVLTVKAQQAGSAVQSLIKFPFAAAGERDRCLCALYCEGVLAIAVVAFVSVFASRAAGVAVACGFGAVAGDQRPGDRGQEISISDGGLVVVSGNAGADDRAGAGGSAGHGRSLRLSFIHRTVCNVVLGSR